MQTFKKIFKADRQFDIPANDNQNPSESNDSAEAIYDLSEVLILRRIIRGESVTFENAGISVTSWKRLMHKLGRPSITNQILC